MSYRGTARGRRIELDDELPLPDGARVLVDIEPEGEPPRGAPAEVLQLAGSLTPAEAEALLASARPIHEAPPHGGQPTR